LWSESDDEELPVLIDDIDTYLNEPPVPRSVVEAAGGAMKYWYTQEKDRPTVALMAMDFISAPGKVQVLYHASITQLSQQQLRLKVNASFRPVVVQ
jgi:hypothetical protein